MSRRAFLRTVGGASLLAACARPPRAPSEATPIRAVAFDLFTLFDPRGVDRRVADVLGSAQPAFAATWKTRIFEYCFLRAATERYAPFDRLVHDALLFACRTHGVELDASSRARLESAFTELDPWPDTRETLASLSARGLRLTPLANFSPSMIDALLDRSGLRPAFHARISTDAARSYKPAPRAYALAEDVLSLPREQIAFVAFGGWDAAGARWFGFPTFWVNRLQVAADELVAPDATGNDLSRLPAWIAERS